MNRTRFLGLYLLTAAGLQIGIYAALTISEALDWLFYFDPRIGVFVLEDILRGSEQVKPRILQWLSAGWLLGVAVVLLSNRHVIKTYIVSELLLTAPSLVFFIVVILANMSPAHGFSIGELVMPTVVTAVFSFIPLVIAFTALRKPRSRAG